MKSLGNYVANQTEILAPTPRLTAPQSFKEVNVSLIARLVSGGGKEGKDSASAGAAVGGKTGKENVATVGGKGGASLPPLLNTRRTSGAAQLLQALGR